MASIVLNGPMLNDSMLSDKIVFRKLALLEPLHVHCITLLKFDGLMHEHEVTHPC